MKRFRKKSFLFSCKKKSPEIKCLKPGCCNSTRVKSLSAFIPQSCSILVFCDDVKNLIQSETEMF